MAGSVNKVILVGNLGRDPEIKYAQSGKKMASFSVATSDTWKDGATGERREKTEWHRIRIFSEGLADIAEKYLKKGAKVYLEGELQTSKWTGNDGIEKYSTEVVLQGFRSVMTMLDSRSGGDYDSPSQPNQGGDYDSPSQPNQGGDGMADSMGGGATTEPLSSDLDDEIPF